LICRILDSTGHVVMLHKMDNTQFGSIAVSEDKARSALYFRRPTKVFEDDPVRRVTSCRQVKGENRATMPPCYFPKAIGRDDLVVEWFYDPSGDPLAGLSAVDGS
jgi:hypothetical protein